MCLSGLGEYVGGGWVSVCVGSGEWGDQVSEWGGWVSVRGVR